MKRITDNLPVILTLLSLFTAALCFAGPQMILQQNGAVIANGGAFDFGPQSIGSTTDMVFTLQNTGDEVLYLSGLRHPSGEWEMLVYPSLPVQAGAATTFTIRFAPTSAGAKTCDMVFWRFDAAPFAITLTGSAGEAKMSQAQVLTPAAAESSDQEKAGH